MHTKNEKVKAFFILHQSFCHFNNKELPSQNSWNKNREALFQNKELH